MAASKVERARHLLAEAQRAHAALEASTEFRCPQCGRIIFKYDPPVRRWTGPCRRCGYWIDFNDMSNGAARS